MRQEDHKLWRLALTHEPPRLGKRLAAFAGRLTLRQKLAAPVLIMALGLARAMVLTLPFKTYSGVLGQAAKDHTAVASPTRSNGFRAQRIGRLIEALSFFTPWNSNCLAQAIVASMCLRALRIGYSVHFGVARPSQSEAALEAHSWVMAGEHPVTGFEEASGMTCVQTFRLERS